MKPIKHEDLGDKLSGQVIGAAISVHRELGPGLDEADYERALHLELLTLGIEHEYQVPLPLLYKGTKLDCGYRMDLVIFGTLLIELKAVDKLHPIHEAQLLTYLRLARLKLGLLINFNVLKLRDAIVRRASTISSTQPKHAHNAVRCHQLDAEIIDAAVEVQNILGPGLLRSTYETCLAHELTLRGIRVERNLPVNLLYRERLITSTKHVPIIAGDEIMIACASVGELSNLQLARARSLLKTTNCDRGYCINFHASNLANQIKPIRATFK
jgi:GxxExxY protein